MILKYSKQWQNNTEAFNHVWQTFVEDEVPHNFVIHGGSYVSVYNHVEQGCVIGNLMCEKDAEDLQSFCRTHAIYSIDRLLEKDFDNPIIKRIKMLLGKCDIEFLKELQQLHDSKQLSKMKLENIANKWNIDRIKW